jgi:hypothetical protein
MPAREDRLRGREQFLDELGKALQRGECWGLVLSRPRPEQAGDGFLQVDKISVRPVEISGRACYQLAERRNKQEFHQNISANELLRRVADEVGIAFGQADLYTSSADLSLRMKGRNGAHLTRRKPSRAAPVLAHDRRKRYLIPEGEPCAFMQEIGVMTSAGTGQGSKAGQVPAGKPLPGTGG